MTLARLSLNQWTTRRWSLREAVDGCVRHGIPAIGLWRERVAEHGLAAAAKLVTDAGLRVSSLCRGGFLTGPGLGLKDNRAAIDEAAALNAACLVLVVGGLPGVAPGGAPGPGFSRDLPGARARVAEALALLAPYAAERGCDWPWSRCTPSIAPTAPCCPPSARRSTSPSDSQPSRWAWWSTPFTSGGTPRC
ncbi:hypothetical protein GCM10027612_41440 [Microbispora bryophytorum subsp. camponoti]